MKKSHAGSSATAPSPQFGPCHGSEGRRGRVLATSARPLGLYASALVGGWRRGWAATGATAGETTRAARRRQGHGRSDRRKLAPGRPGLVDCGVNEALTAEGLVELAGQRGRQQGTPAAPDPGRRKSQGGWSGP